MRKLITVVVTFMSLVILIIAAPAKVQAQCYVNIPDAAFKSALLANGAINTNSNGEIECAEQVILEDAPPEEAIIRSMIEFLFKENLEINVLTQHRKERPYGIKGGGSGKPGEQFLNRANGDKERLKGMDSAVVAIGDRLIIKTPGGGAWG